MFLRAPANDEKLFAETLCKTISQQHVSEKIQKHFVKQKTFLQQMLHVHANRSTMFSQQFFFSFAGALTFVSVENNP